LKKLPSTGSSMKRRSLEHAACPIARSLDSVGEWWSLLIVRDALLGKRRFGEFQSSLGLAKNILTARLRKLVSRGIFHLEPAADGSAYQEYVLTDKGRELGAALTVLRLWGYRWLYDGADPTARIAVDRKTGDEVVGVALRTGDGRFIAPRDVDFVARGPTHRTN
jgi:DNA-binding HxlR family transcriptional regulator